MSHRPPAFQGSTLRALGARLVSLFRRPRMDADLDEEIRDHLERSSDDYIARGLDPGAARAAALAAFGGRLRAKELHAEVRGFQRLESLWRDAWYAARVCRKAPAFSAVVVATLALGIGATSAIFALVNAVVFRPLPFHDAAALVRVTQVNRDSGRSSSLSPPNYFDLRERAASFSALAAYWTPTVTLSAGGGAPERIAAALCTASLTEVLGVAPQLGRAFTDEDDAPGAPRVALVSDGLWRRTFGGDPGLVGRTVRVDDTPVVVVGVMPAGFAFPAATDLWLPLRLSRSQPPNPAIKPAQYRQYRILSVVGRLAPAASLAQARAELATLFDALERDNPATNRRQTATAVSLHEAIVGDVRLPMLLMLAAVACLLLIASANVATLVAVRTASREREVTMRLALGAGRGRIAQQMLVENMLLALVGGAAGLLVAYPLLAAIVAFAPPGLPRLADARIDTTVAVFAFAAASAAGFLVGLAPALRAGRRALVESLKAGARASAPNQPLRRTLVAAEVALSMLLLMTAGLLVQTVVRLGRVELGFHSTGVYVFDRVDTPRAMPVPGVTAFYETLLQRLRGTPGVASAGATIGVPLDARGRFFIDETTLTIDGLPPSPADPPTARLQVVSDGYFEALGIPIVAGRAFTTADAAGAVPVAIANRAFVQRYLSNGDAVGRTITHQLSIVPGQPTRRVIVGVAADVRQFRLDEPFEPLLFIPHAQMPWPAMALVVRTSLHASAIAAAVRNAVSSLDASLPAPVPVELATTLDEALGQPRLRARLLVAFASAALILAAIGLYGTVAFAVQQRRSELAIRLVLGATARQTRALVLREGLALSVAGTAAGALGAIPVARVVSTLLFGVGAFDLPTTAAVAALLLAVSAVATYLPARAIERLDPLRVVNGD